MKKKPLFYVTTQPIFEESMVHSAALTQGNFHILPYHKKMLQIHLCIETNSINDSTMYYFC